MDKLILLIDVVRQILWGKFFIPLFAAVGVVCVIFIIAKRGKTGGGSTNIKSEVSPMRALFANLGATIGTGNIVGVSLAIGVGGAGSVFWMWMAAILGMAVSYAENAFGVRFRRANYHPVPYMPRFAAVIFSLFVIPASFGMGNMAQANSAALAAQKLFGAPRAVTGIIMSVVFLLIVVKGLSGILKFTDKAVPIMGAVYVALSLNVIFINRAELAGVFKSIFLEAFGARAIAGGAAAGAVRGIFSGEAGLGSSVILTSRSNAKSAEIQGLVGAGGIFIDTIVLCTLTALVILASQSSAASEAFGKTLGVLGENVLNLSIIIFAFTTIVGWSYFGATCGEFLFGRRFLLLYRLCAAFFIIIGAVTRLELVWGISDIFNAAMALPNLICVMIVSIKMCQGAALTGEGKKS
ncbi:MAG: alanine:cation symporter family protein [Clostridia bacterium]|nr:alanine:cation symporter family protein [Clostridia bacterium]